MKLILNQLNNLQECALLTTYSSVSVGFYKSLAKMFKDILVLQKLDFCSIQINNAIYLTTFKSLLYQIFIIDIYGADLSNCNINTYQNVDSL